MTQGRGNTELERAGVRAISIASHKCPIAGCTNWGSYITVAGASRPCSLLCEVHAAALGRACPPLLEGMVRVHAAMYERASTEICRRYEAIRQLIIDRMSGGGRGFLPEDLAVLGGDAPPASSAVLPASSSAMQVGDVVDVHFRGIVRAIDPEQGYAEIESEAGDVAWLKHDEP